LESASFGDRWYAKSPNDYKANQARATIYAHMSATFEGSAKRVNRRRPRVDDCRPDGLRILKDLDNIRGQGKISKLGQPENVAEWVIECEHIKVVSSTVK
jgi:hypothetical protein